MGKAATRHWGQCEGVQSSGAQAQIQSVVQMMESKEKPPDLLMQSLNRTKLITLVLSKEKSPDLLMQGLKRMVKELVSRVMQPADDSDTKGKVIGDDSYVG